MPTLTGSRTTRTVTLCVLYAAQGMPWGFVTIALLSYLAGQGAGLEETAKISSLATLPWTFKVFWGPIIDRFTVRSMGRRRPWILFAQFSMSATLLAMILIGDLTAEFETLAWMVFLHNCFVSLQDVASDALAVDVLLEDERGRVNGMMWASNYAGSAIGGAGMGTVIALYGLRPAFCLQAGVLFLIICVPLLFRERAGEKLLPWSEGEAQRAPGEKESEDLAGLVKGLIGAFAARAPFLGILFAYTASIMIGMRVALMPVFYTQEIGWSDTYYSQIEGGVGAGAGIVGALIGGFLADRLGVKTIVTFSVLGISALCVAMGVSPELRSDDLFPLTFLLVTTFLISMMTVASFSLFMRLCTAAVGGTQYTFYMAMANLARVSGAVLVAALEDKGYRTIFIVMAVAIVAPLVFLYPIKEQRREIKA
jgi:PAT family beta-lactamase induction signal transducer AmpG